MKRYLLVLLLTGCTTYPEYVGIDYPTGSPNYTPTQPPLINYNTLPLQEYLVRTDAESIKLEQFVMNSSNREDLLIALRESQQANRRLYQKLQNPWNGFYLLNVR
jgi:hypothetical protein